MYSDVNCPYCNKPLEINHDDGYGYSEGETFQQQCEYCDKTFVYTTTVQLWHDVSKAECLNGGEHDFKPQHVFPKEYTKMECSTCGEQRQMTDTEKQTLINHQS